MKTYIFTVTEKEAELIGACLAKAPFEVVVELIGKLQQQVKEQNQATEVSPESSPTV